MPATNRGCISDLHGEDRLDALYRRHRENNARFEAGRAAKPSLLRRLIGGGW